MPRFGTNPFYTGTDDSSLVDVPFSAAIGAAARQQWADNPTVLAGNADIVQAETQGRQQSGSSIARFGRLPDATIVPSETVSQEDAKARIDSEGLTGHLNVPKTGIPKNALDILVELKNKELRNQFLVDRYHGGVTGGAAMLGTKLAVAIADPLNIASGFVPVVGEARVARLLEMAGTSLVKRAAVRTGIGAAEGTVGQALLEPLYYTSKQQLQSDYTTEDSLRNIAFGGLLGGALHVGVGGVSDVLAKSARVGAWAETINSDGTRHLPELPEGAIGGGGTHFVDGNDYVRGQFAVVDAATFPKGEAFDHLEPAQLGESPYADSGAPVLRQDGAVVNGSKRLATVADAYSKGKGDAYRTALLSEAEKYGLDSEQVKGMAQPVLVRVESSRDVGSWGERAKALDELPQAQAVMPRSIDTPEFKSWFGDTDRLTPEQHATALQVGVAQAVNDLPVDVSSVRHLDGTRAGVERFLAERKAADAAESARLTELSGQFDRAIKEGQKFDGQTLDAMQSHVKQLETDLREEMKASGIDPAELDNALDESNANVDQLAIDTKAYKGIAMCMERSA